MGLFKKKSTGFSCSEQLKEQLREYVDKHKDTLIKEGSSGVEFLEFTTLPEQNIKGIVENIINKLVPEKGCLFDILDKNVREAVKVNDLYSSSLCEYNPDFNFVLDVFSKIFKEMATSEIKKAIKDYSNKPLSQTFSSKRGQPLSKRSQQKPSPR